MGIHKYQYNDKYILLDINSSNVFIVDKLVYLVLDYYPQLNMGDTILSLKGQYSEKEIQGAIEEIDELIISGKLFSKETKVDLSKFRGGSIKALCLNVSHDCNLACKYCFASENTAEHQHMSFATAKAAIDFLIEKSVGRKNLEVDFFGGEPLMNFEVVKKTVHYALSLQEEKGKNFRFTITTNGMLLDDEKMEFINKYMRNIVFSIDGRKSVHDNMRPTKNGGGSYDIIIEKIKRAAASREGKDYFVRGTFTKNNLDFSLDVESLANEGLRNLSMEPVVCHNGEQYAICKDGLETVFKQYDHVTDLYFRFKDTDSQFNFFHFNIDLDSGGCAYKRLSGCGAGSEYLCIDPYGNIYPCHQFVGNEAFIMGNVEEGITRDDIKKSFVNASVLTKEDCKSCWARYYCGGGCYANAYNENHSLNSTYPIGCEMHRKRVECGLYIKCAEKALKIKSE